MILNLTGIRHISQGYQAVWTADSSGDSESASLKGISLNKNKIYKIKNLNFINASQNSIGNVALTANEYAKFNILFNNDEDFLNNLDLAYLAYLPAPTLPNRYINSSGGVSFYPYPNYTLIDIEPTNTRQGNFSIYSITRETQNIQYLLENFNSITNLLRIISGSYTLSTTAGISNIYSNYVTDFTFYNNLSNRLNIFCYISGHSMANPASGAKSLQFNGSIDFDLEEYSIED